MVCGPRVTGKIYCGDRPNTRSDNMPASRRRAKCVRGWGLAWPPVAVGCILFVALDPALSLFRPAQGAFVAAWPRASPARLRPRHPWRRGVSAEPAPAPAEAGWGSACQQVLSTVHQSRGLAPRAPLAVLALAASMGSGADGVGVEDGANYAAPGAAADEYSTATLQRLAAALQEEGSAISAEEEARAGGRRRPLFRRRHRQEAAGNIPEYGKVLVLEASTQHSATIIWLHDEKCSPRRWKRRLDAMGLSWCRVVIPAGFEAPSKKTSTLGKLLGLRAPSVWFEEASDYGLASSLEYIQALVAQEVKRGIAPDRIVIAGAGQGGDVAVLTGLLLTARLGGVVSLAAHLPQTIALLPSPESAATPFLCWVPPQDLDAAEAADTLLALVRPACSAQPLSQLSIMDARARTRARTHARTHAHAHTHARTHTHTHTHTTHAHTHTHSHTLTHSNTRELRGMRVPGSV